MRVCLPNIGDFQIHRHTIHRASTVALSIRKIGLSAGKKMISLPEALAAQEWDFVTIQQASPHSFRAESQEPTH